MLRKINFITSKRKKVLPSRNRKGRFVSFKKSPPRDSHGHFIAFKKKSKKKSLHLHSLKKIKRNKRLIFRGLTKFTQKLITGKKKKVRSIGDLIWNYSMQMIHPWKYHSRIMLSLGVLTVISGSLIYVFILQDLPNPDLLTKAKTAQTTIIRDRNGSILYRVYKKANRVNLTWDEIPEVVKKSTIAIEDADFYSHHGISFRAIVRAFLYNLKQENIKSYQGASTITQQLVKNRLLNPQKTYVRKIKEIVLAVWTELKFSKQDILTLYLNEVGYGGPAYGIEAAAQMYFGIPARNLNLAQAAFLAGLPAAPTTFSPFGANPQLATTRQIEVLSKMRKLDMISGVEFDDATNSPVNFAAQKIDILAPHFVMFVKNELSRELGEDVVAEGGLDVTTTLDLGIQSQAEEIVRQNIEKLKSRYNIHNAAVLVTSPENGEILAMVGSVDYFDLTNQGYVNAALALRQPGSSIKPINYAYALDHGWTPTSTIDDSPVIYTSTGSKEKYAPVNYDGKFHGRVTLRSALASSYNIPAVKVLNSYGVDKMINQGRAMGIRSWNSPLPVGLSLTLGGAEVTMLDMARAYGTINNLGVYKDLKIVKSIVDSDDQDLTSLFYEKVNGKSIVGKVEASENQDSQVQGINTDQLNGQQVISPLSAFWLTDILADNIARLPAFGPYAKLTIPGHKVAVKTGTSNNFRDNWTIGFTPDYLVAAWVGNNDGSFMNKNLVSGITGAAPIWNEVMSALISNVEAKEFPVPQGLIAVKICATNGLLTCPNCPQEKIEYFTADKVPTKKCSFRPAAECTAVKAQAEAENKSEEEKKTLLAGCAWVN